MLAKLQMLPFGSDKQKLVNYPCIKIDRLFERVENLKLKEGL